MKWKIQFRIEELAALWCRLWHTSIHWPAHGEYRCAVCFRRYPVPWDAQTGPGHRLVTTWVPAGHDSGSRVTVS